MITINLPGVHPAPIAHISDDISDDFSVAKPSPSEPAPASSSNLAEYWTVVPRTYRDRDEAVRAIGNAFYTEARDSSRTARSRQHCIQVYSCHNFSFNQRETSEIALRLAFTSTNGRYSADYLDIIKNALTLIGVDTDEKAVYGRTYVKFMYKGIEIIGFYPALEIDGKLKPLKGSLLAVLEGYKGQFKRVLNILLNKFDFRLNENYQFAYCTRQNSYTIQREYAIGISFETICGILGLTYNASGIYYGFSTVKEMATWFLRSKVIGKSSFYISEDNEYVGPTDYFDCPLFETLVEFIMSEGGMSYKAKPTVLDPTIRKHQMEYIKAVAPKVYCLIEQETQEYLMTNLVEQKYGLRVIQEVTGLSSESELVKIKDGFESWISRKEDFDFFALSSSEETIRNKLVDYVKICRA